VSDPVTGNVPEAPIIIEVMRRDLLADVRVTPSQPGRGATGQVAAAVTEYVDALITEINRLRTEIAELRSDPVTGNVPDDWRVTAIGIVNAAEAELTLHDRAIPEDAWRGDHNFAISKLASLIRQKISDVAFNV